MSFKLHNSMCVCVYFPAGSLDWVHICRSASKVVTFIDLAGHEKYLKTTIFGMTGHAPDFCMLMVGSNAGIIGMTKGVSSCTYIVCILTNCIWHSGYNNGLRIVASNLSSDIIFVSSLTTSQSTNNCFQLKKSWFVKHTVHVEQLHVH